MFYDTDNVSSLSCALISSIPQVQPETQLSHYQLLCAISGLPSTQRYKASNGSEHLDHALAFRAWTMDTMMSRPYLFQGYHGRLSPKAIQKEARPPSRGVETRLFATIVRR